MALLEPGSKRIILASQSPRRIELLKKIVTHFEVEASEIVEDAANFRDGQEMVIELSRQKAEALARKTVNGLIIGADSVVIIDNKILGKPRTKAECFEMLRSLSGKTHQVFTGFTLINADEEQFFSGIEKTDVKFRILEDWEIEKYIDTNSPFDKAGSYGIQDDASVFVESIRGCYYNVMGLPVTRLYLALKNVIG